MVSKKQFQFYSSNKVAVRESNGGMLFTFGLASLSVLIVISLVVILPL